MKRVGITHRDFDVDAASCLRLLERLNEIDEIAFLDDNDDKAVRDVVRLTGATQAVFVDAAPRNMARLESMKVQIFDNHSAPPKPEVSSFDLVLRGLGPKGLSVAQLEKWRQLVWHCDRRPHADNMDIQKAVTRIHAVMDDIDAYRKWFVPIFDAFLVGAPDDGKAAVLFRECANGFLERVPKATARPIVERWLQRLSNVNELVRDQRNILRYVSYMEPRAAKEWLDTCFNALEAQQVQFRQDREEFSRAYIEVFGNTLVISQVTASKTFLSAARSIVYSKEAPPQVRERITDRSKPWILVRVTPETMNFQIFGHGSTDTVQRILDDSAKAIRAETLARRKKPVPSDETVLKSGGTLPGTEPLYFHSYQGKGYSNILWGSNKKTADPASELGANADDVRRTLIDIVRQVLDDNYFVDWCDGCGDEGCPLFPWQLSRCIERRNHSR